MAAPHEHEMDVVHAETCPDTAVPAGAAPEAGQGAGQALGIVKLHVRDGPPLPPGRVLGHVVDSGGFRRKHAEGVVCEPQRPGGGGRGGGGCDRPNPLALSPVHHPLADFAGDGQPVTPADRAEPRRGCRRPDDQCTGAARPPHMHVECNCSAHVLQIVPVDTPAVRGTRASTGCCGDAS